MRHSRETLTHFGATGIIYRSRNPAEIFLEMKGDAYPLKVYRRRLCLIGGSWSLKSKTAKNDRNPRGTFLREFQEEISFAAAKEDSEELYAIFGLTKKLPRSLAISYPPKRTIKTSSNSNAE